MKSLSHDSASSRSNDLPRLGAILQALALVSLITFTVLLSPALQASQPLTAPDASGTIVVLGDSLSSEYGIRRNSGWVQLLRERLAQHHPTPPTIINASISGDTTSSGLTRLPALLAKQQPDIVIVELGGNDALRGLSLDMTRQNLLEMIELSQSTGATVVLAGMQIPANYGPAYTKQFRDLFPSLAAQTGAQLIPFLLAGLETDRDLFISDGIHPAEHAQPLLLENVWAVLEPTLASKTAKRTN
jgi:acyl-CoA thioesterase-1